MKLSLAPRLFQFGLVFALGALGCAGDGGSGVTETGTGGRGAGGTTSTGGTTGTGTAGTTGAGGTGGTAAGSGGTRASGGTGPTGGTLGTGGTTGVAGSTGTGGAPTGAAGARGVAGRSGGAAGTTGTGGTAGTSNPTGAGGNSSSTWPTALDCGPDGLAIENHGPPLNRVNFVVFADGYNATEVAPGGLAEMHMRHVLPRRFSENAQPYLRYRNFVNICLIRPASTGKPGMFGCACDGDRTGSCNTSAMNTYANSKLPKELTVDWRAGMFNSTDYCNSGGQGLLTWAGGHSDASAASLHEGGHAFHALADEYADCIGTSCGSDTHGTGSTFTAYQEINSCGNPMTTDGKWDKWIGYNQANGTGLQSTWSHSRYNASNYRPTANSMMNSMFCGTSDDTKCTPNTAFNSVSREQIVMSIWKKVKPIDSTEPPAGAVSSPGVLKVNVIDPLVINVDWTVDGTTKVNGGTTFDTSTLAAGSHTVSAKAYDNAGDDLVRYRDSTCQPTANGGWYCHRNAWKNSVQTVTWTFTK